MTRWIPIAVLLVCAGACSQEVPSLPPAKPLPMTTAPASASTPAMAPATDKLGDAGFSLSIEQPNCSATAVAKALVRWDVTPLHVADVSIYVESPGNQRKLWVDGAARGAETTGVWVFDNSAFILVDKASGAELATRRVDKITCSN